MKLTDERTAEIVEEGLYEEESALEQAMTSEEHQEEGTFLTGGGAKVIIALKDEKPLDREAVLHPPHVKDGEALMDFLRGELHRFESPYAYVGGEANAWRKDRMVEGNLKVMVARLSTYEAVSLSMSHSLMAQIYHELPYVMCDFCFLPKPLDYAKLREAGHPVWFGLNTKWGLWEFDVLSITHAVSLEQLSFVPLLYDSGIPIFKDQRMDDENIPIIVMGGANAGTPAPLFGDWLDDEGKAHSGFVDCIIYGDGEQMGPKFLERVRAGKEAGLTKREILRGCHGEIDGFYEHECYDHVYKDGKLVEVKRREGYEYAEFPVSRATVINLDEVKTLEKKMMPHTGDGATVDVSIAGNVGCIGSAGWGACSFCREGSEGPYRERSLDKVLEALSQATRNQGTKEVSLFSLNFNQYADLFPLVLESVKRGFKVGLISQRVDMLAETPEQIAIQRWLKKTNFTLGIEGISGRIRAYLNKNLQEWEILLCLSEMMKMGAGEIKFFMIVTGEETEADKEEFMKMMETINALREKLHANTRFRVSFTPLFPTAFTALQWAPCWSCLKFGSRSLDSVFDKARELGWGRRLSVSGEEPLVSNLLNQAGRNLTPLLIDSHFRDDWRFYGNVPKGTWARWMGRIDELPDVDLHNIWEEKPFEHIFPWEDFKYSTSKLVMWRGYLKAVAGQGVTYCLSTRTVKGVCQVNECGACDPKGTGKPVPELIKNIVGRRVAPTIPPVEMARAAATREKTRNLRVKVSIDDPLSRFVRKGYFGFTIPRALMLTSDRFYDAYVGPLANARRGAGAHDAQDWTFGQNIYDFAMSDHIPEGELRGMIEEANETFDEGRILGIRMDHQVTSIRADADLVGYSVLLPSKTIDMRRLETDVLRYWERRDMGKENIIKVRHTIKKGVTGVLNKVLEEDAVRGMTTEWAPEFRGTVLKMVVKGAFNPLSLLEAVTQRAAFLWKNYPIFCEGYWMLPEETGEVDVFAALEGDTSLCSKCRGPLERDTFDGTILESGVCYACDMGQMVVDPEKFSTRKFKVGVMA
jgi:radical SAM superfamily enzyme YgiQ (UPF0313 family)